MFNGQKPLDSFSVTIPAGSSAVPGCVRVPYSGVNFYVRAASGDFKMQFDYGTQFTAGQGYAFEGDGTPGNRFNHVNLFNESSVAVTVQGFVGQLGVRYIGTDNFKAASTFLLGNMGRIVGQPNVVVNDWNFPVLRIGVDQSLTVPGTYKGHRRKLITLTITGGSFAVLTDLTDRPISAVFYTVNIPTIAYESSDDVKIWARNAAADVIIGEIYYAN